MPPVWQKWPISWSQKIFEDAKYVDNDFSNFPSIYSNDSSMTVGSRNLSGFQSRAAPPISNSNHGNTFGHGPTIQHHSRSRIKHCCNLQSSQDWSGFFCASVVLFGTALAGLSQHAVWLICVIWPTQRTLKMESHWHNHQTTTTPSPFFPLFSDSFPFRPVLRELLQRASFSSSPQESHLNSYRVMTALLKLSFVIWWAMPDGCFSHCDAEGRKRDLLFLRRQLWQ